MKERMILELRSVIAQGVTEQVFPGAVVCLAKGNDVFREVVGHAEVMPERRLMQGDTVFDIASLTKVTATLPAVLRSVELGHLALHEPIANYIPDWLNHSTSYSREDVTVYHLLTHTSGLPAWKPFYVRYHSADEYLQAICREPLEDRPGSRVVYSDLGFMLLGFLLERVSAKSLDVLCRDLVFAPLGLHHTSYRPKHLPRDRFAATEQGNQCEYQMALSYAGQSAGGKFHGFQLTREEVEEFAWRTTVTCGTVNDGNAYYGLQGVSGHAGLFSTADDLLKYARAWLENRGADGQRFLREDLRDLAMHNQTLTLNVARTVGFEAVPNRKAAQPLCSAGEAAPKEAFGHTGFTGTSLWIDGASDTCVVTLTNRVHPHVKDGIADWRKAFHHAVFGG